MPSVPLSARVKMRRRNVLVLALFPFLVVGCYGSGSPRDQALFASCEQMKVLREYNALPVLMADQIDLRVDLANITLDELLSIDADPDSGLIEAENLTPCDY